MRAITKHIVHCSDSEQGNVAQVRRWHRERGWEDVGYHFIIRRDGEVEIGRTLDDVGAHCQGHNVDSVGTCLIGKRDFLPCQFVALRRVHAMLRALFGDIRLHGHCEFNAGKTCPNFNVHDAIGE
jgi:N-acetylmuramoyl-L-alanine amidase